MDPAARHRTQAEGFARIVEAVDDWAAPTPVPEWTCLDVVDHLVTWPVGFFAGGGIDLPAAPAVADDPAEAWRVHTAAIQALLDDPDRAEGTFAHPLAGTHRLADAIDRFYTTDVLMHRWDLATAGGAPHGLDPDECAAILAGMESMEDLLRSSGQYGPAVPVADDADPVDRLAAFIGRDPAWRPPA
ncbi:MAG: TIGR03086 family protein [Acidimicrobiales bacterium]|nr:TIGR03086 family protein [Acidimicrobiales bacterium]